MLKRYFLAFLQYKRVSPFFYEVAKSDSRQAKLRQFCFKAPSQRYGKLRLQVPQTNR